jgi:hypothetical protein
VGSTTRKRFHFVANQRKIVHLAEQANKNIYFVFRDYLVGIISSNRTSFNETHAMKANKQLN